MKAAELIEIANKKGLSIARVKSGTYQYSANGHDWINVDCSWSEFSKIIKAL